MNRNGQGTNNAYFLNSKDQNSHLILRLKK